MQAEATGFRQTLVSAPPTPWYRLFSLQIVRTLLHVLGLVGEKDGRGYGNLSQRVEEGGFRVTGKNTGKRRFLPWKHYVRVLEISPGSFTTQGIIEASTETPLHHAMFKMFPWVGCVIHIHNRRMWERLRIPRTSPNATQGTVELAQETVSVLLRTGRKICALGGHRDGIVVCGRNPFHACALVLWYYLRSYLMS